MNIMRAIFLAFVLILHGALPARAQSQIRPPAPGLGESADPAKPTGTSDDHQSSFGSLFSDLGHEIARLPSKRTVLTLGIGGALALAAYPADRVLTERATMSEPLDDVFEIGAVAGSGWMQVGGALGTYVVGRAAGNGRVQAAGTDLVQVQIINGVMTQGIKLAVRRTRPDQGRFSFPSGHASSTFATATVLQRH